MRPRHLFFWDSPRIPASSIEWVILDLAYPTLAKFDHFAGAGKMMGGVIS